MSNLSNLKDALITAAAEINDDIDKYDCLAAIDDWFVLRSALTSLQSGAVQSYAIAGRSVTRRNLPEIVNAEAVAYQKIRSFLRGSAVMFDNRGTDFTGVAL